MVKGGGEPSPRILCLPPEAVRQQALTSLFFLALHMVSRIGTSLQQEEAAPFARRVAARDSGKAVLDAVLGEVIVTCEKIHWLCNEGERWLKPEKRSSGILSFYKSARVEYHPVGVVGETSQA